MQTVLPRDRARAFLVVIPTLGDPAILGPCLQRVVATSAGQRVRIVVMVQGNSPGADAAKKTELPDDGSVRLDVIEYPTPLGFGGAVNAALGYALAGSGGGIPQTTIILNDDARPTAGWMTGLRAALDSTTVRLWGEPTQTDRPVDGPDGHGRLGIAGPASNNAAGIQGVPIEPVQRMGVDQFAAVFRQHNVGNVMAADFLSGFCLAIDVRCMQDLWLEGVGLFDADAFPIGGYEDNDLAVRAELAGWRLVVAGDVYVHHEGHRTLDRFPGQKRGMANRLRYLRKWAPLTQRPQKLVAVYRVSVETANDLVMLRASIARVATMADGIALLLTASPGAVLDADDYDAEAMDPMDHALIHAKYGTDGFSDTLSSWVTRAACAENETPRAKAIRVATWGGVWNERDERNAAISLAEGLAPDWIWAIDHDEIPEDRVTRRHLDRLMRHPDPLIRSWDFGWLNHWDSERLVRTDRPWGGMRGFRLWRANAAAPRRILAGTEIGLHCGNSPDHDPMAKRVSGIRFRHFGYLRDMDRVRKHARYQRIDPNPDAKLTGGGYGHLVHEEGMRMTAYSPRNGIGLHVLVWEGEDVLDVARWLDQLHGLVDEVVLVWTGTWDDGDKPDEIRDAPGTVSTGWLWTTPGDIPMKPPRAGATGPSQDLLDLAMLHACGWVHRPLADDLAGARNAGIGALASHGADLGWAMFVDPDEVFLDTFGDLVAIRTAAESTDAWGWMMRFENRYPHPTPPALSDSVRISRLDPDGRMRMNGRVHEEFGQAIDALIADGIEPRLRVLPFVAVNPGMAKLDHAAVQAKLERYERLIRKELADRPDSAPAWVSLAMQYGNDSHDDAAHECLQRAVLFGGTKYLPYRELSLWHLRRGTAMMAAALERLPPGHHYRQIAEQMVDWLRQNAPAQTVIGVPRSGQDPAPLPAIPDEIVRRATGSAAVLPSPKEGG